MNVDKGLLLGKCFSFLKASWTVGWGLEKEDLELAVRPIYLDLKLMEINRVCKCLM